MQVDDRQTLDKKRDLAARAAWLSFIADRTQDEIAGQLGLSRQAVQRLIAFALSEKLIKFRLDYRIAEIAEVGFRIQEKFSLKFVDVAPSDEYSANSVDGVALLVADRLERILKAKESIILNLGTGRTLRAAVEQLETMHRPKHKLVSLVGNISSTGAASPYDVVMRLGDKIGAEPYPLPAPVVAATEAESAFWRSQPLYQSLNAMRARADATFVGIGAISESAPVRQDGFFTAEEIKELVDLGAVGELTAWPFDGQGAPIETAMTARIAGLPLETPPQRLTVVAAAGLEKLRPMRAALRGGLCTAAIIDETLAKALLEPD